MSEVRLIDANALMERLERKKCEPAKVRYTEGYNDALMRFRSMVHGAPTVDAVPVTRCGQCKHGSKCPLGVVQCKINGYKHRADWFCPDGKGRNET